MLQELTLIGNLGGDPELRHTTSGSAVCNFSLATNRKWTGADGNPQEETVWFRVASWGKQGEACSQYLSKGSRVYVKGRLTIDRQTGGPRIWQAQDGSYRASFEVTAMQVQFLGGGEPRDDYTHDYGYGSHDDTAAQPAPVEDEIPF